MRGTDKEKNIFFAALYLLYNNYIYIYKYIYILLIFFHFFLIIPICTKAITIVLPVTSNRKRRRNDKSYSVFNFCYVKHCSVQHSTPATSIQCSKVHRSTSVLSTLFSPHLIKVSTSLNIIFMSCACLLDGYYWETNFLQMYPVSGLYIHTVRQYLPVQACNHLGISFI